MAIFETTASASDLAQASLACGCFENIVRALRTRSGIQTRGRSLKPNPNPKQWFRKGPMLACSMILFGESIHSTRSRTLLHSKW